MNLIYLIYEAQDLANREFEIVNFQNAPFQNGRLGYRHLWAMYEKHSVYIPTDEAV